MLKSLLEKGKSKGNYKMIGLIIIISVFLIDRLVKWLVISNMSLYESVSIIPGFLDLTYVLNTGIAFSFFNTYPGIVLIIVGLLLLGYLIYNFRQRKNLFVILGLSLMIGGTLGNLLDRLLFGGVVDFIHFYLFGYSMPIFNTADTFIFIGICLWILGEYYES